MKTARFTSLIALLIAATGAQAQLRSVTRPTIQIPLGTPTLLQPQFWNTSPAIGTATAPTMVYIRVPRRNQDRVDVAERERAQLKFEMECAARGLPSFQFALAGRYLTGNGVPRDPEKAFELLQSAAEKGHDKAKRVLERFEQLVARRTGAEAAESTKADEAADAPGKGPEVDDPKEGPPPNGEAPTAAANGLTGQGEQVKPVGVLRLFQAPTPGNGSAE